MSNYGFGGLSPLLQGFGSPRYKGLGIALLLLPDVCNQLADVR
jgi:hypothetical protein